MAIDDSYPEAWRPPGTAKPAPESESPARALVLAVESYIAALADDQAADLWARTRPEGR